LKFYAFGIPSRQFLAPPVSLADVLLPRVTWPFHRYGCFAVVDIFASSLADAWSLVGLLADALLSSLLGGLLCRRPLRCCISFLQAHFIGVRCRAVSLLCILFSCFLVYSPGHSPPA
jgi:hypothetical protein